MVGYVERIFPDIEVIDKELDRIEFILDTSGLGKERVEGIRTAVGDLCSGCPFFKDDCSGILSHPATLIAKHNRLDVYLENAPCGQALKEALDILARSNSF